MNTCAHCGGFELARRKPPAQPRSVFGSPEDIIEHGTDVLAVQTERLGVSIAKAVHGLTNPRQINAAIKQAGRAWPVRRMALPLMGELLHGAMLGALDADFEARTNRPVAVPSFSALHAEPFLLGGYDRSKDPAFATRPVGEARKRFEQRQPVTRDVYDSMSDAARRRSVTVAGAATADIVRTVQRELVRQVEQGADLRDFSKRVVPRLEQAGWTPVNDSHAENVLRTNIGTAYNAGRAQQMTQPTVLRYRPFWQIVTVNDGPPRQRPTHRAVHLVVLRADDPFWLTAYPPFGYQCRCRVRNLSYRQGEPLVVSGSTIRDLPDRGFTSGLPSLDIPPVPPANDTIPPPANDTIPPPPPTPAPAAARRRSPEPLGPDALQTHIEERADSFELASDAHERMRRVFRRGVTADELDAFIGYDAFGDVPGQRTVSIQTTRVSVKVKATVARDIELERSFLRRNGKLVAHHDILRLPEQLQGSGIGARVIQDQLAAYETLGVDRIELDAAWVGRYYWPKLGFDLPEKERRKYVAKFGRYLEGKGLPADVVSRLTEGITSMRDLATTRLADAEVGKDFLLGDPTGNVGRDGMPERGPAAAGFRIDGFTMKVEPGDPTYDRMKAEVSKPRRKRQRAERAGVLLAADRRDGVDPEGEGLADDLIGDDAEPVDGWRQFDAEGYRVDSSGKRIG